MDRQRLRALRAIREDLASRPGGEAVLPEADRLVKFYARAWERGDVLATLPRAQPGRGKPLAPNPRRRKRRLKPVTEDYVLAILQEAGKTLAVREIREQLVARGREPLGRQGMSYVLRGLWKDGKIQSIETGTTPVRVLWKARG